MSGIKKTNAMRMLDSAHVDYEAVEYEYDEDCFDEELWLFLIAPPFLLFLLP